MLGMMRTKRTKRKRKKIKSALYGEGGSDETGQMGWEMGERGRR